MTSEMNQFEYFTEIEEAFVRLRGKSLLLSPMDWDLIESWKDIGVPLHVVLRSLEKVFESNLAKARRRPIQSLSYCKSEVEAQFGEWRESRVGAAEPGASVTGSSDSNPFAKDAVLAHLEKAANALVIDSKVPEGYVEAFAVALDEINEAKAEFEERSDVRKLEEALTKVERELDAVIVEASTQEQIAAAREEAEALFAPYKSMMASDTYWKQVELLLKKRLREIHGVPRLSLFYL
jgi:hypothetical protein